MNERRKIFSKSAVVLLLFIIILILPFIIAVTSSYTVLVKNTDSGYFIAKDLFIAGDYIFCIRDSVVYKKSKEAVAAPDRDYNFAFISMNDIANIEIISEEEDINPGENLTFAKMYLGKYKVDVSGNAGFLYLSYSKKRKIYGTIRFPEWAHGVFEPLKNLRIKKGKIAFIRSVETMEEARRVGAPTFFTQEFHGEYKDEGNVIEGYYLNRGAKMMWRGYKIKEKRN